MGVLLSVLRSSAARPLPSPSLAGWSRSVPLLDGDGGTSQTISGIRNVVSEGIRDSRVRAVLAQILHGVDAFNETAEAQAIYNWILQNIRFTSHPVATQLIQSPNWTLAHRIGNCTDINAVLMATMLMQSGIRVRLVTIANDPTQPQDFSHVYCEAWLAGQWVPMDAAIPGASFGKTISTAYRKHYWSLVDDEDIEAPTLQGLGTKHAVRVRMSRTLSGYLGDDPPLLTVDPNAIPPDTAPIYPTPSGDAGYTYAGVTYAGAPGPGMPGYVGPVSPGYGSSPSSAVSPGIFASLINSIASVFRPSATLPPGAMGVINQPGTIAGIPTNTLLIGGLLIGAVVLLSGKKR